MKPENRPRSFFIEQLSKPFRGFRRGYLELRDHRKEARLAISDARLALENTLIDRGISDEDLLHINSVIDIAYYYHLGQRRFSGEPYITHPLKVAAIVAQNDHIKANELREHVELALCHDLYEDSFISEEKLRKVLSHPSIATGVGLLSKFIKSKDVPKKSDAQYFIDLLDNGTPMIRRVKIADWIHNLQTTPSLSDSLSPDDYEQVQKFQGKFGDTSRFILPLIRTFDEDERAYLYETLSTNYNSFKPDNAPPLQDLAA